jgi:hypothetical protein
MVMVPHRGGVVMTVAADAGFVEMRLGKVAGVSTAEDHPSFCVVLALNLVALVPAPILVAADVLADAEIKLAGDSPEAIALRHALEHGQMAVWRGP